MKKAAAIVATMIAASVTAFAAPPKVATVRVADVHRQLASTVQANEDTQAKREALKNDKRQVAINEIVADLGLRRKKLAEGGSTLDAETRKKLEQEFLLKQQEAKSLESDFETFRAERHREINAEMVTAMRARLDQIRAAAEKIAQTDGYDWIFDTSGQTNTGVPLVLYVKSPNDLTDRVLAVLGPAPKEPKSGSAKPPAPQKNKR